MAANDKTVAIRLVVLDGGAVKAELKDVGTVGEQSLARIDAAAGSTSRALTVIDGSAANAGRSLVTLDQASGGLTRSLSTANDNAYRSTESLERLSGAADRTSKAVSAIPKAFELLAAVVAIDVAVRTVGLLRDVIASLGRELIEQGKRFHEWAQEADGATGSTARYLEYVAARQATLKGLELAGASFATRAAVGTAASGVYITAEAVGALVDASKAARDYAAAQKAIADELDRTGHASQRTTADISALSQSIGAGTRYTTAQIADTARELLKFRSVTGETFDRAVRASADLAAKLGTDLPTAANLLGRALEDPSRGIAELAERGVNLTYAQEQQAKSFEAVGEKAKAQGVILEGVSAKTGDAAAKMTDAERASKHLSDAWDTLSVTIGNRLNSVLDDLAKGWTAVGNAMSNALAPLKDWMAGGFNSLNAALSPAPLADQLDDVTKRLKAAKSAYEEMTKDPGADYEAQAALGAEVEILERKRASIEQQIAAGKKLREEEQRQIEQRKTDERGRAFAGERGSLDRQLESVIKPDAAAQIAKVNDELAKTRTRLDSLRAPDGSNKADIDKAIADAERLAAAKRKAIEDAGKGTGRTNSDNPVDRQIDALREERDALGMSARERAQYTALLRAEQAARQTGKALTLDQAETIQYEAGALYDAREAQTAHNKAMAEGARIAAQFASPSEAVASELIRLQDLLDQGAISWETYSRASDATMKKLEGDTGKTKDVAREIGMSFTSAFEDAVLGGKKLSGVLQGLAQDLARLALRKAVTEPLLGAATSLLGGIFHTGGIVGVSSAPSRTLSESAWAGAPRYHTGGVAGLAPGEVPAILKQGEGVFTPEQMSALGDGAGGGVSIQTLNLDVNLTFNDRPTPENAGEMSAQIQAAIQAQIRGMMANEMRQQMRPGGLLNNPWS